MVTARAIPIRERSRFKSHKRSVQLGVPTSCIISLDPDKTAPVVQTSRRPSAEGSLISQTVLGHKAILLVGLVFLAMVRKFGRLCSQCRS